MNNPIKTSLDRLKLIETTTSDIRDVTGAVNLGAVGTQIGGNLLKNKAGIAAAGKIAGNAAKFVPYAGAAYSAADSINRAKLGDLTGAAIAGAGAVPILGIPATAAQAIRDKYKTGSWFPDDDEITKAYGNTTAQPAKPVTPTATPPAPGFDPKVQKLQQKLIAKGAKIKADGVMGQKTRDAMKQFGGLSETQEDITMSESEKIAALRARLTQIDESNPFPLTVRKIKPVSDVVDATSREIKPVAAAPAAAKNPSNKKVAAAAALGGAAGAALMAPGGQKPPAPGPGQKPNVQPKPPGPAVDQKALDELDALARILGQSQDQSAIELMGQYNAIRKNLPTATPVPGEMEESIEKYIRKINQKR
jgi:hypothetical protein